MEDDHDIDEEEFEFSRNYFLAKESGGKSGKKSARKLSEIDLLDEQVNNYYLLQNVRVWYLF